jgi:hypothetical protein
MKFSQMFPSKFLSPADLGDDGVRGMSIDGVEKETIEGDEIYVLYFRGERKGLRLNKTNGRVLVTLYGDESDDWAGQRIELYVVPVQNPRGDMVDGIRLRAPKQARGAARHVDDDDAPAEPPSRTRRTRQAPPVEPDDDDDDGPPY